MSHKAKHHANLYRYDNSKFWIFRKYAVWMRGLQRLDEAGYNLHYTAYHLRDTFITNSLRRGFSSVFIGKYCDTSATMIERRYAVATDEILQELANG